MNYLQDSWDAEEDEETKKPEVKVPEKKTKSKLEQKIAEREVSTYLKLYTSLIFIFIIYAVILNLTKRDFKFTKLLLLPTNLIMTNVI